jgi:hypothetical protein
MIPGLKKVMTVSGYFSIKTRKSFKISNEQTLLIINFGKDGLIFYYSIR